MKDPLESPLRPLGPPPRQVGRAALAAAWLVCAACAPAGTAPALAAASWQALPGPPTALGREDAIDEVDLVVDGAGVLHALWREVDRPPDGTGLPTYRTLHAASTDGGASWSHPQEVPVTGSGRLVAAGGGGALVAVGADLRPVRRREAGGWEPLAPLAATIDPRILAFDVEPLGEGYGVAFVGSAPPASFVLSFVRSGGGPPVRLATAPGSVFDQPAPRLHADGDRLHLLWGISGEERSITASGAEAVAPRGRVLHLSSGDGGETWSAPVELSAALADPPSRIESVALTRGAGGPTAVFASFGLYASRPAPGGGWTAPVRITRPPGAVEGTGVGSLSSAAGALAWVDDRLRQTDRRWWKPLGGWPWSDAPDWADNDVFFHSAASLRSAVLRTGSGDAPPPERLTTELSFTGRARLAASPQALYLLRAGRREVGKQRASRGFPPELFLHRLPLD